MLSKAFVTPVTSEQLITLALKGMLHELDPTEGEYYTKEEAVALRTGVTKGVGQIGVDVRTKRGALVLVPSAGGPAARAGLRANDRLLSINGNSVENLSAREAVRLLEGPPASSVRVKVVREEAVGPLEIQVVRTDIALPSVTVSRPSPDVAVLHLLTFDDETLDRTAEQLSGEWKAHAFKGLVMDLRGSPGGLLASTVGLAAMFLKDGDVVGQSMGQDPDANQVFGVSALNTYVRSGSSRWLASLPESIRHVRLVVLVDEATSGGAEMVAAALKDHRRATLLGRPTFGRGNIHTVRTMPGGGVIKYTSAYWLSPSGKAIDGIGVQPDRVISVEDAQRAIQLAVQALSESP